jgi:hypothetical protein
MCTLFALLFALLGIRGQVICPPAPSPTPVAGELRFVGGDMNTDFFWHIGKIPDGKYKVIVANGATYYMTVNLESDSKRCKWNDPQFMFQKGNSTTLIAKDCDLSIVSFQTVEMVFIPIN